MGTLRQVDHHIRKCRVPAVLGLEMLSGRKGSDNDHGANSNQPGLRGHDCAEAAYNEGHGWNEHASAPSASASCNGVLLQHPHARPVRDFMHVMLDCDAFELELPVRV